MPGETVLSKQWSISSSMLVTKKCELLGLSEMPLCWSRSESYLTCRSLCANIGETTSLFFITVEGEESMDVKRYGKQRSPEFRSI